MHPSSDAWSRIGEIFDAVRSAAPDQRESLLTELVSGDMAVRKQVELLLAADADDDFLLPPIAAAPRSYLLGRTLGAYRIEQEIGRGGMGVVYESRHVDAQLNKRVAIKTLAVGLDRPELLWRFRREQQILAQLEHPNIAALYDGGTTDDGIPYLVMEFVEGERIDRWCEQQQLSIVQRLDLVRQACAAVQYAHSKLVVHRDLKPNNILVTSSGVVKLLDFGVAKLLETDSASGEHTVDGFTPITAAYASPEQLRGEDATTQSDVYALGVVLYRLLSGSAPFALDGLSPIDTQQRIFTELPPLPSEGLTDRHARSCAADVRALRNELRGDLDAIVLKALRKEPARRYASVEALSEDILRYLKGQPVQARPERMSYRMRSFIRRHRVLVTAGAIAVGAMAAGTVISVRAASLARAEARRTARVSRMLETVIGAADPLSYNDMRLGGTDVSLRQVLDSARTRVPKVLADDPAKRADLYRTFGNSYLNLDELDLASAMLDSAIALHTTTLGAYAEEVGLDMYHKSQVDIALGDPEAARTRLRALRDAALQVPSLSDSVMPGLLIALGQVEIEGFASADSALALMRAANDLEARRVRPRPALLALAEAGMAVAQAQYGNALASDSLVRSAMARVADASQRKPAEYVYIASYAGFAQFIAGRNTQAVETWRLAHTVAAQTFGPRHLISAETQSGLAWSLLNVGAREEGLALLDSALAVQLSRTHTDPSKLSALYRLRMAYALAKRDTITAAAAMEQAAAQLPLTRAQRPLLEVQLLWLAAALDVQRGQAMIARTHLQQAATVARSGIGPKHPLTQVAEMRLATFTQHLADQSISNPH